MSVTIDPTVHLDPSPALLEHIRATVSISAEIPVALSRILDGEEDIMLTVSDLKWLVGQTKEPLGSLMLSCSLKLPSPQVAQRSKELEERCAKLRLEQQEKEYRAMTDNVRRDREKGEEGVREQMREVNGFLLLIMQFVVSVVCSFFFGYLSPYFLWGKVEVGPRLLFGIVCGFAVGCADMYFVIRHMLEEDGIKLITKKID